MNSPKHSAIAILLICSLIAYVATGVGESIFVITGVFSFVSPSSKLPFFGLVVFLILPPVAFIVGCIIFFRVLKSVPDSVGINKAWKKKYVLLGVIILGLNYILAIYLPGFYLKPLSGIVDYCLQHLPDW